MHNIRFEGYAIPPGILYPHLMNPHLKRPPVAYINSLNQEAHHPRLLDPMPILPICGGPQELEEPLIPDDNPVITSDHATKRLTSSSLTSYSIINNPPGSFNTSYASVNRSAVSPSSSESTFCTPDPLTKDPPTHVILPTQFTIEHAAHPEPTASQRNETYAYYLTHHPRLSRQMIQQWFLHTYQRHISVTQVNSIIHTCGEVPQSRFSHRRDTPRKDYNYEEAMERERVVVWRWYTRIVELEGKSPTMSRVASWWETADGGRMLGMSTLSSILTKMRQRQYEVVEANKAAKHQANINKPTLRGGIGAESRETGQVTGSLKRGVPEDREDDDNLIGPWCKPGKEAEEVLTELLRNKRRTGYMYPGTSMESLKPQENPQAKPQAKRRKVTPAPGPPEVVHDHIDIDKRMWNWWRRHRDNRRISTANIVTKIENYWTELEKAGPAPDFNAFAESFKTKYNLVTNEGGPYPADMLFMYQGNGPTMSTKLRGRRFPENNKPWC